VKKHILATLCLSSLLAACGGNPPHMSAAFTRATTPVQVSAPNLAIAPLIDARPATWKRAHAAGMSSYWGLALVYFAFGSGRIDGIAAAGDKNTSLRIAGGSGGVAGQLDAYVRSVVSSATGGAPATAAAADLSDVRKAAAGRPDGVTIVPILDQFDAFYLSSEDSITGGSSYQSGDYQVTTSGYASGSANTGFYANLRLRLVMLETRGGQVVRQATAYVATSGKGTGGLTEALEKGVAPLSTQLAAFVAK
jgi:hypothetical protein